MNNQNTLSPEFGSSFFLPGTAVFILFVLLFFSYFTYANDPEDIIPEEIPLTVKVDKVGNFEIPAVIASTTAYLSITDLFGILNIKYTLSPDQVSVEGYFLDQNDKYLIDYTNRKIHYRQNTYEVNKKDLIKTVTGLYIKIGFLKDIFNLDCTFHFRSLSVLMKPHDELPLFRKLHQEEKRKYLNRMKVEMIADSNVERSRPFLYLGAADWAVYSTQNLNGAVVSRGNLSLGGFLAGGETTLRMNYYTNQKFDSRNLHYRWRHINNQSRILKQFTLGKIATSSVSSVLSPVIGAQISNSPTTFRRFFATHTITDHTEPGWTVELYVNNTMVDYTTADASGLFKFDVPLSYGKTEVKLRYYGEWGEEHTEIRSIQIPYSFLPKNEFEYQISGGVIENEPERRFFRSSFNYGLNNRMTIGGGYEYLDAAPEAFSIPFLKGSFSLSNNIFVTVEYAHEVKATGMVAFRLPSNLLLDISFTDYVEGQRAIYYNYLEERNVRLSFPVRFKKWATYSRLTANQLILPRSNELIQFDHVFSSSHKRLSANLRTNAYIRNNQPATVYSELSTGFRLSKRTTLTPTIRYSYNQEKIISWKFRAEKSIFRKGNLTMSYEEYPELNMKNIQFGLRIVLSGVQTSAYANIGNRFSNFTQSASGGLLFDRATSHTKASSMSKTGRGGLTILSFLDMNSNGKREKNEPKINGIKVRSTPGGQMEVDKQDTLVRIYGLEAYSSIYLEINADGLENIAWQLPNKSFRVTVEPNLMRLVEVPVSVLSEVSGSIQIEGPKTHYPGQFKINIFREDNTLEKSVYSDNFGNYNYFGLLPGDYSIRVDSTQLINHHLISHPISRDIKILPDYYGFFVNDQNFVLSVDSANKKVINKKNIRNLTVDGADSDFQAKWRQSLKSSANLDKSLVWFSIQILVSDNSIEPESSLFQDETDIHELKVDQWYKYYSGRFQKFNSARSEMLRLRKKFRGAFIVTFKDGQLLNIEDIISDLCASQTEDDQNKVNHLNSDKQEMWYTVQVAATIKPISIPSLFKGETNVQMRIVDNYYKYSIGKFNTYQQTVYELQRLQKKFPNSFIIAFKGCEQVEIDHYGEMK